MDANNIELDTIEDLKYKEIIALIIDAINDFPKYNLSDTDEYFEEIKVLLGVDEITYYSIESFLESNKSNDHWEQSSLIILADAFSLMNLYSISFKEVKGILDKN